VREAARAFADRQAAEGRESSRALETAVA